VKIVTSVVFCLCPPVFGMSPCPNLGQLRIEGKSFVERGESLSESLQIAIHLWLWAPAIQNDRCSKRDCPKTANIAHRGSDRISPLRVARFSSRWAHAVREPPVLPGLNRHWPDTLANGAMAHMSSLVFFAGYDGFRSTSPRRTLISRLWNRDLCSRSGLRAPRSVIEIRRCVPTSD